MIAVIYKDIMTLKKNALFTVLSCVAAYIYGLYSNNIFAISFICILMPLILMIAIFDYDSKSKFCQFAFSAPVKRRDYIIGKLFFSFIIGHPQSLYSCHLHNTHNAWYFCISIYIDTFDYKIRDRKGKDDYDSFYKCLDYIKRNSSQRYF